MSSVSSGGRSTSSLLASEEGSCDGMTGSCEEMNLKNRHLATSQQEGRDFHSCLQVVANFSNHILRGVKKKNNEMVNKTISVRAGLKPVSQSPQ